MLFRECLGTGSRYNVVDCTAEANQFRLTIYVPTGTMDKHTTRMEIHHPRKSMAYTRRPENASCCMKSLSINNVPSSRDAHLPRRYMEGWRELARRGPSHCNLASREHVSSICYGQPRTPTSTSNHKTNNMIQHQVLGLTASLAPTESARFTRYNRMTRYRLRRYNQLAAEGDRFQICRTSPSRVMQAS